MHELWSKKETKSAILLRARPCYMETWVCMSSMLNFYDYLFWILMQQELWLLLRAIIAFQIVLGPKNEPKYSIGWCILLCYILAHLWTLLAFEMVWWPTIVPLNHNIYKKQGWKVIIGPILELEYSMPAECASYAIFWLQCGPYYYLRVWNSKNAFSFTSKSHKSHK